MDFRPPLCTYRLNWAKRTSWGHEWDDTAFQTQDSKFEPCSSEAEHATSRSWRLPTRLNLYEWTGKKQFVSLKLKGQSGGSSPRSPTIQAGSFNYCTLTATVLSSRVSGEETICFFETWRPEWGSNPRSPTIQAGSFNYCTLTATVLSSRVSGEETICFFETWRPEWGSNPRSPTFQAGSFNYCSLTATVLSSRVSGEVSFCFFETWRPEWGLNPRSPTFQAGSFKHCTLTAT